MFDGPNITRSHGLLPPLNSSSVLATNASAGTTSVSIFTPSLSYRSFSTSESEYLTYSAFTTARMVWPSYGFLPWAGAPPTRTPTAATAATTTSTNTEKRNRIMWASLGLPLRPAEGQALHEISLQDESHRESRKHAEHDRGRGLAVEHVGTARGERRDQHHHRLGLDPGEHDGEQELVPRRDEREQRDHGEPGRDDRHDDRDQRAESTAAVDERRLLDLDGKVAQEPDQKPHREGDVDDGIDDDEPGVAVGQSHQLVRDVDGDDERDGRQHPEHEQKHGEKAAAEAPAGDRVRGGHAHRQRRHHRERRRHEAVGEIAGAARPREKGRVVLQRWLSRDPH